MWGIGQEAPGNQKANEEATTGEQAMPKNINTTARRVQMSHLHRAKIDANASADSSSIARTTGVQVPKLELQPMKLEMQMPELELQPLQLEMKVLLLRVKEQALVQVLLMQRPIV